MKTTQRDLVREHLEAGKTITSLEALRRFGIMHLPRRILDLREMGLDIVKTPKLVRKSDGSKTRVIEYSLRIPEGVVS